MRSVKKTRVTLFIADPGIVSVKMEIFLLMSDMSGEYGRSTFTFYLYFNFSVTKRTFRRSILFLGGWGVWVVGE